MKLKTSEKQIQKTILDYLRLKKVFCWKQSNVGIKKPDGSYIPVGMLGISDILGIVPRTKGRMLCIEVKSPGQKPSDHQLHFIDTVNKEGGLAFVADSLDSVIAAGL